MLSAEEFVVKIAVIWSYGYVMEVVYKERKEVQCEFSGSQRLLLLMISPLMTHVTIVSFNKVLDLLFLKKE